MAQTHGYVIALDGPDGVGKTTQLGLLADYLQEKGCRVHTTRHSGGTPIGEELRKASLSEHPRSAETDVYISLAMGQALSEDIHERKARGEFVLLDRSPLAVLAYNGFGSQLADMSTAYQACERLFKSEEIDVLLFLNAPQNVINARREKRGTKDYFETKNAAFHERVRNGYEAGLAFLQDHAEFGSKVVLIDATASVQDIHKAIVQRLEL
jgi:dTMP kinase